MEQLASDFHERTPSSRIIEELLNQAPPDHFTLGWVASTLHQRSFGIIMLFLGLLATIPIGSMVPSLILAVVSVQMIAGHSKPRFPHFVSAWSMPTRYLLRLGARAIPVMRFLEKVIHPRWSTIFEMGQRSVGFTVLLLTGVLLLTPVPLSNIAPAILVVLISLAYVEEDGLLLFFALLAAIILIGLVSAAVWETVVRAVS